MTTIKVGTFNLNNLFSRFNFKASLDDAEVKVAESTTYTFEDGAVTLRKYLGNVVKAKPEADMITIADRIVDMDLDVLAVQEVEDIDTLKTFAREHLKVDDAPLYPYVVLIEGNDSRLIDVGLLSKYPLGPIVSWQCAVHPDAPEERVFSRDLLQVEVLDEAREKSLLTVFNTHMKSQFIPFTEHDKVAAKKAADLRRKQQAEVIASILETRMAKNARYLVVGDMNDTLESACLAPFSKSKTLKLVNGLAKPKETQPSKAENPPPKTVAWTHRFKESGKDATHELLDQIWLSPALSKKQTEAWIGRRSKLGGDGSDHDPAWVVLKL